MTFTHEMGHIAGGLGSGGRLQTADLYPWHLPYRIFDPDPRPLITLWCGPLLGIAIPLGVALLTKRDWTWFIANFCLLANGAYLTAAWFSGDRYLDTPKLLEHGASLLSIALYCLVTVGSGYVGFRRSCIRFLTSPHTDVDEAKPFSNAVPVDEQSSSPAPRGGPASSGERLPPAL